MLKAKRTAVGQRITAGADKAYATKDHIENRWAIGVTPHVAENQSPTKPDKRRRSAIDGRTPQHGSYRQSQKRRKMIEWIFGWGKQHGTMGKTKQRRCSCRRSIFAEPHRLQLDPNPETDCRLDDLRKHPEETPLLCRAEQPNPP